jgi:glycerol-3-phosphate dehydrogenase (NAD(P)+)
MANVVILGAGLMGTAFSIPLTDNGHRVHLVGTHLDGDIIEEIHESRMHPRLRTRVAETVLPYTYDRLGEAIQDADLVVLGVNSLGVDWAAHMLGPLLPPQSPVLMLTKGLAGDGHQLHILPDALRAGLPADSQDKIHIVAIGGPSIAGELAARRHSCVMLTGSDQALLDRLAALLRTPYYHIWTSTDTIGVEVCVALKNVYALAVGLVGGLLEKEGVADNGAVMHNLAAAIFAQGLWEISYLVEYMGGQQHSVYSLPGAGDQYVTSQGGRNGRMGRWLGLGLPYSQAKAEHMPEDTIEGAQLAQAIGPTVERLVASGELDGQALPLLRLMIDIVCHDAPVQIPWDEFFARRDET